MINLTYTPTNHFTTARGFVKQVENKCNFLEKLVFLPFEATLLIGITAVEVAKDVADVTKNVFVELGDAEVYDSREIAFFDIGPQYMKSSFEEDQEEEYEKELSDCSDCDETEMISPHIFSELECLQPELHEFISDFLSFEDIYALASTCKVLHASLNSKILRINPNHFLYPIVQKIKEDSKSLQKSIQRKIIADLVSSLLPILAKHLLAIAVDGNLIGNFWSWKRAIIGSAEKRIMTLTCHDSARTFSYQVESYGVLRDLLIDILPITLIAFNFLYLYEIGCDIKNCYMFFKKKRWKKLEREALREVFSYPAHLSNDPILKNYLIKGKVPLLPCIDSAGKKVDYFNTLLKNWNTKNNNYLFDKKTFKRIQKRIRVLINEGNLPNNFKLLTG